MPPFSVLDLSPILQGGDASLAFRNTLDLARHAERWGYRRFWLAEHHNMRASPAPRRRWSSATWPPARRAFASGRGASCSPTMLPW